MKILTLSTYPFNVPTHGGQHRLFNIVRILQNAGHLVQSIGVSGSENYPSSSGFVAYPGADQLQAYIENPFLMEDWAIGELFSKNKAYYAALAECVADAPDLIYVEQPWLFNFALAYRKEQTGKRVKIIYGSQNIEHKLKFGILKNYVGANAARCGADKVLDCELFALREADCVFCVSDADAEWSREVTSVPVFKAQNGVRDLPFSMDDIIFANEVTGGKKFALYCASAHPPNVEGFLQTVKSGIGCFSPDERLVVVGSAGSAIEKDRRFTGTPGLRNVYINAGIVSDSKLKGLLHTCHAVILPILEGGGTNLKTAEALWSKRHVVATPMAMRGFESFSGSPGLFISDSSESFCDLIRQVMIKDPLRLSGTEELGRRAVLWEETLKELEHFLRETE